MNIKIEDITVYSTISSYSWDLGVPNTSLMNKVTKSNDTYVCYAPHVNVAVQTTVGDPNPNAIAYWRKADFGDFYNSSSSSKITTAANKYKFTHNYVMPGVYKIALEQTEYAKYDSPCYEEPCESELSTKKIYTETGVFKTERPHFAWIWYNFLEFDNYPRTLTHSSLEPNSELVRWEDCVFQGKNQTTWEEAQGPAIETTGRDGSWTKTKTASELDITIEVKELPPKVYLDIVKYSQQSPDSHTVRLSPRLTRCGSFPIEKIIWDLGNGTPSFEVYKDHAPKRGDIETVFSNVFEEDAKDPRNFDIIYTYTRNKQESSCFYPSITAISSSTGTSDCASVVVGPISFKKAPKFQILQNHLFSDGGKAYLGQIDQATVLWNNK